MDEFARTSDVNKNLVISDVKTRVNSSIPPSRISRAAEMQLSLYHELLAGMIDCTVDMARFLGDLGLDRDVVFSDAFLAEIAEVYTDQIDLEKILESNTLHVTTPHP
jgi:exonuclease V